MNQEQTRVKFDNITGTLQKLVDQTKVKASLLKLETREVWEDLSKVLFRIQSHLKQDVDQAQLQSHLGLMEARQEWNDFKKELKDYVDQLNAGEKVDHARLQAHLAKMEMADRWNEEKKQWQDSYEDSIKPRLNDYLDEMHEEMETLAKSLRD